MTRTMQWKIDTYQIFTTTHTGTSGLEPVTGFVHYSGLWGIHAFGDTYHLTHLPSGKRIAYRKSPAQLREVMDRLTELPVQWDAPEPVFSLETEKRIALILHS